MNTIVIGDTHGSMPALYDVLKRAGAIQWDKDADDYVRLPDFRIIQIGDLANMAPHGEVYRGFVSQDKEVLQFAQDGFIDEIVIGNHELLFTHGLKSGYWYGMASNSQLESGVLELVSSLVSSNKYIAATEAHGYLLTHAGIAPRFQRKLPDDPEETAFILNDLLIGRATRELNYVPVIDDAGYYSGGRGSGGMFWLRPDEVSSYEWIGVTKYKQIVGHTPNKDNPYWDANAQIWYIDSGGYMQGEGAGLVFREGADDWEII